MISGAAMTDMTAVSFSITIEKFVIGGSMAGLLAARVLADFFSNVTVIERDEPSERPEARRGVPQGRHAHGLLLRGQETIRYQNNSPDSLPYLWMYLDQNICAPNSVTQTLNQPPLVFQGSVFDFSCRGFAGGVRLESVRSNGADLRHEIYGTTMKVHLPHALPPRSELSLEVWWSFPVPEYGAARILVLSPEGRLLHALPVPDKYVTNVALDDRQRTLYITAPASNSLPPYRGSVWRIAVPLE